MMYAKQSMKCVVYECMMMFLAFDTLVFLNDAQANFENITAKDILQRTLKTVTSRPPMMADGDLHGKWTDSVEGIREVKYVSRVYIRNQQHDTTRDTLYLIDGKWAKTSEHRGIWDGSRYTLRERSMPSYTASGYLWPGDFYVVYKDKPHTVEWGMRTYSLAGTTRDEHFAKLLLESETLRLRPEMEQVDGFACYVVEGDTPSYYHTVWIDPQNGYLHRKIICEGYQKNLPYEGSWIIKSGIEVTDVKIEYFEGIPVVTEAKRHSFNERTDGNTLDAISHEKMSNVVWNPDFESMGAFKMDKVPDGTRVIYDVNDLYKTGVKFQWQGGRIVPNVDEEVIEQIDKITEEIMAEGQVPVGLEAKKTKAVPNDLIATANTQPKTQVDAIKTRPEVLAESGSLPIVLVILISFLIIGLIAWMVFRRLKT